MIIDINAALYAYGDCDFVNEGGQFVLSVGEDTWLEVIVPPDLELWSCDAWEADAEWTVYRVEIEQYKHVVIENSEGHLTVPLVPVGYNETWTYAAATYTEWFFKDLEAVASFAGVQDKWNIINLLYAEDVVERGWAYIWMGEYFGWYEFDQYPLTLSATAMAERYGCEVDIINNTEVE